MHSNSEPFALLCCTCAHVWQMSSEPFALLYEHLTSVPFATVYARSFNY